MQETNLHVKFLLNVFICCCLLHNLFRFEDEANIDCLMWIIELKPISDDQDEM
jgi:hypothetical protein